MNLTDYRQVLTTAGQNLTAKINMGNGKVPLDITRAVISSDENGDPLNMAVSDVAIALNMEILSKETIGGVRAKIRVKATNIGKPLADPVVPPVMKSFLMRRIFFFANDPDDGEIVYRVSQYSSPNYVPAIYEVPWTYEKEFNFTTGNASDVTIVVDPTGFATVGYVNELKSALGDKVDKVPGMGLSTNDFTTALKTKLERLDDTLDTKIAEWLGIIPIDGGTFFEQYEPFAADGGNF